MPENMQCYKCGEASGNGMDFDVMRVSAPKTAGSRAALTAGQKLERFETHRICDRCIDEKLKAIEHPMSGFADKFKITSFAFIAGIGLMIANWAERNTAFIVGAVLVGFFVLKLIRFISAGRKKKANFARFSQTNARFVAAWECLSEVAPRKDEKSGRSIFFIPVTKATYEMKTSDFVTYYKLSEENARTFSKLLQKRRENSDRT